MPRSPLAESTLRHALEQYAAARQATVGRKAEAALLRQNQEFREILDTLSAAASKPLPEIRRRELGSGLREATAVFGLSDVHAEERVRLGEVPVPNEYSPAIAEQSIGRFFAGAQWLMDLARPKFQVHDALLWLGGDLMSGHIHEELKENTATPPIQTLLWLRPRIMAGIDRLLSDSKLERLQIVCSYGNHGRNTPKPYRALGAVHSYEWLLYQWLGSIYEHEPRVQFLADESAHQYAKAYGFDLHFHHGDETNYQGGVGGITIPLNKAVGQWDKAKRCHYHHFGHWHQYIDSGRIVVNGSVIGFNSYAMSIKAEPEEPQQFFYLLDSKRGKTGKHPIWVRDRLTLGDRVA